MKTITKPIRIFLSVLILLSVLLAALFTVHAEDDISPECESNDSTLTISANEIMESDDSDDNSIELIIVEPTTPEPIANEFATVEPTESNAFEFTTIEPTTTDPIEIELATVEPTEPIAFEFTTIEPTTFEPTTDDPFTAEPTTLESTNVEPTTVDENFDIEVLENGTFTIVVPNEVLFGFYDYSTTYGNAVVSSQEYAETNYSSSIVFDEEPTIPDFAIMEPPHVESITVRPSHMESIPIVPFNIPTITIEPIHIEPITTEAAYDNIVSSVEVYDTSRAIYDNAVSFVVVVHEYMRMNDNPSIVFEEESTTAAFTIIEPPCQIPRQQRNERSFLEHPRLGNNR